MNLTAQPQPKWTLTPDGKEWVIRWFILTTHPFKETPVAPGAAAETGEGR